MRDLQPGQDPLSQRLFITNIPGQDHIDPGRISIQQVLVGKLGLDAIGLTIQAKRRAAKRVNIGGEGLFSPRAQGGNGAKTRATGKIEHTAPGHFRRMV